MNRILIVWSITLLGGGALVGCAASPPRTADQTGQPQASKETVTRRPGEPVVAASPQSLLRKDAVRKVQQALDGKGYRTGRSGVLDTTTKEALRRFQKKENIAATGLPDQLTLQRLDLDPKDILGENATSKKGELEVDKPR
jgi:peptidoglycan hydrolase-like protein with peptidoglycan-binding domain